MDRYEGGDEGLFLGFVLPIEREDNAGEKDSSIPQNYTGEIRRELDASNFWELVLLNYLGDISPREISITFVRGYYKGSFPLPGGK